jgi:ELWxxDGT repeat protein
MSARPSSFIFILFLVSIPCCVLCQPFTLVKDINRGVVYSMPKPSSLIAEGGFVYFKVGDDYTSYYQNDGPAEGIWKSDGSASGTTRIKSVSENETIDRFTKVQHRFFFTIFNFKTAVSELWKSDGTSAGTSLIKSWPVATIYLDEYRLHDLVGVNETLYFTIRTGNEKTELWKSDGSEAGTTLVKSFDQAGNMVNFGGTLFFGASENNQAKSYNQLWKTDGTNTGTVMVKDVDVRYNNNNDSFAVYNGELFFMGFDALHGAELWKSNGTDAGTMLVKDIEPGDKSSNVNNFAAGEDALYFFATTSENGNAFWRSDGTANGTVMVKDLGENPYGNGSQLVNLNGYFYFNAYHDSTGAELWRSDGTEAGTMLFKDMVPGPSSAAPWSFFKTSNAVYFAGGLLGDDIWKTDGTEDGTILLKAFKSSGVRRPYEFAEANGFVFFSAFDDVNGNELRKTDGTPSGTTLVTNLVPTPGSDAQRFVLMGGKVYFTAFNSDSGPGILLGRDIYQTDGTFPGTISHAINPSQGGSDPLDMTVHNSELYISAKSRDAGYELWKSTGGKATRLKDIYRNPGSFFNEGSNPGYFKSAGPYLYFAATDIVNGRELWKTDGTEEGTVMVKNIHPAGNGNPQNLENVGSIVYFAASNGTNGVELWKSDGTEGGTVQVKDVNLAGNSNPSHLVNVNGILYFTADDGINGIELWRSDGTEKGTYLVKNIRAGSSSGNPAHLTAVNNLLFFSADDGLHGTELWKSDGTEGGTIMVRDIFAGGYGSDPSQLLNLNGLILFAADNGADGRELWKSDGTETGTLLVKDILPGSVGSNPTVLTKIGNLVMFGANDGFHGNEVWLSNGKLSGTRLVSEIETGPGGSDPTAIFEYGPKVLVAATQSLVGNEIRVADMPADIPIMPDATITSNGPLTNCNGSGVLLKVGTGSGYTYQWKKAGVNIPGANAPTYSANSSGEYSVAVTDPDQNTAMSQPVFVTISLPPMAIIVAGGPLTFCSGKSVLLRAGSGTGYTYQWKKAGFEIANATQSSFTATEAGVYSVSVTNTAGCSATSSTLTVTVNSVPVASVAASGPLTFCEGKTVTLRAIVGNGYTYQWKRGAANIENGNIANLVASATGIYSVTVTNASGCSATSIGLNVTVKPLPFAVITPAGPTTFCSGKSVLLKANTGTNYTYQWIRGATAILDATQSTFAATLPGQYSAMVTNSSGCSVTSAAVAVTVNPLPSATITAMGPLTFCSGQSVLLRGNTGTNYTYQWRKNGINITDATQVNFTANAPGAYSVIVTNAAGCAVTSSPVTVTVNSVPLANVVAASTTTFCAGKNVLLKAIAGAGYSYQWKKNSIDIAQESSSTFTAVESGTYSVWVTNAAGCSSLSTGIPVSVLPAPLATAVAAGPVNICEGKDVLLKAIFSNSYTYQWKKNGSNIPGGQQSNYLANSTGAYVVAVTNTEGCTTNSNPVDVLVSPLPVTAITASGPLTFPQGGSVLLSTAAGNGFTFQWKKNGVVITGANTESYTATEGGSYTVLVTNASGCQANSSATIVTVTQSRPITKSENSTDDMIRVYPNPLYRNDFVNIDWNTLQAERSMSVTIMDAAGRKISSQILTPNERTIKLQGASGVYFIECRWGQNQRRVFSIVKVE